jgi:hypothetical protein
MPTYAHLRGTHPSRLAAMAAGKKRYDPGYACPAGHSCDRYVVSFTCVECSRIRSAEVTREREAANSKTGTGKKSRSLRARPPERLAAISAGRKRYAPDFPCRYGHTSDRYAISNVCVECSRLTNLMRLGKAL